MVRESTKTRSELLEKVWQTLIDINVPLTTQLYNAKFKTAVENGDSVKMEELLNDLENNGLEPDQVEKLINFCFKLYEKIRITQKS